VNFSDLIGEEVLAMIPIFGNNTLLIVTIHGVESGGIWIESEKYTKTMLEKLDLPAIKTPIFFVPYHEIRFVVHSLEKIELSEGKFGE
jgi:hypothetical protein